MKEADQLGGTRPPEGEKKKGAFKEPKKKGAFKEPKMKCEFSIIMKTNEDREITSL